MSHSRVGREREAGQALLMITTGVVLLLGLLGLVVDLGWGYYRKQVAQAAVDSAVLAAVVAAGTGTITCGVGGVVCNSSGIPCTSASAGTNLKAGCQYGAQNGIANANMTIAADLSTNTPIAGVSTNYWVRATVSENLPLTFLRVMGLNNGTVAASATGAVVGGSGAGGGCVYILDNTVSGPGLMLNGASMVLTCGVYINNKSTSNALNVNGGMASFLCYGTVAATCTAGKTIPLNMVSGGGISSSGSGCKADAFYTQGSGSNPCSTPTHNASAVADPLASLPAPAVGACDTAGTLGTTGWSHSGTWSWSNMSPSQTIHPGVYCGGLNLGGGNVTLTPGTYIINGGGLTIQGASTTVNGTGNGVFFYNTGSGATDILTISGQPTVNLLSPNSGTYQGIFFMQDHNDCPSSSSQVNGNTNIQINGSIYLHCTKAPYTAQTLLYTGQSTSGHYSALVVDKLTVNGMSNLVLDPTGGSNTGIGLSVAKPVLIQ